MCYPMNANDTVYAYLDESTASTSTGNFEFRVNRCTAAAELGNTKAEAQPLVCGTEGTTSVGDVDFFTLGSPPDGSRVFALVDGAAASSVSSNFDLRVTNDALLPLEYDNSDNTAQFGSNAPQVSGTPLVGPGAYLRINQNVAATGSGEPYVIYSVVQPPIGSATPETAEPNNTIATAARPWPEQLLLRHADELERR